MLRRAELCDVEDMSLNMGRGQGWVLYFDDGPGGPCGQSMSITCPHASFHVFPSEKEMRAFLESRPFRNKKGRVMSGVVGEWTSPGVFSVVLHENGGA